MLRKAVYPKIESLLNQAAAYCRDKNITPNQLTLGGLALNFLAGYFFSGGHLFFGSLIMLTGALGDLLDGPLARLTGKTSPFGAFLDSTIDRYSDIFLFGGLGVFFASTGRYGWLVIVLGIIQGAFVTSYAKARAENLIQNCSVGIVERAERIILLAIGTVFTPLLPLMLLILFFGTQFTALQRIFFTRKALAQNQS